MAGIILGAGPARAAGHPIFGIGPVTQISGPCSGQNTGPQQAVDPVRDVIYEAWTGCGGIGFSRSTDGMTFSAPVTLPGSAGGSDPALAVAPDGTLYVVFLTSQWPAAYPVVLASTDNGLSFPRSSPLTPPDWTAFGARPDIAVGGDGAVYVTWTYGPDALAVRTDCPSGGGCGYTGGELNAVLRKSTDGGLSWGPMVHLSPDYPDGRAVSTSLLAEPGGRIDVEFTAMSAGDPLSGGFGPGHPYVTSSADGGGTWSAPVPVGGDGNAIAPGTWWADGWIAADRGGTLYVSWDSQGTGSDTALLSWSADHGVTWSAPVRVAADTTGVPHLTEVAGGTAGTAYLAWLSSSSGGGWAMYVRWFSVGAGWLSAPVRSSAQYGDPAVWPGDAFGMDTRADVNGASMSWSSAVGGGPGEIFTNLLKIN